MRAEVTLENGIIDATALDVRAYEPADLDQVLALLSQALGEWPILEGALEQLDPHRFFCWKHEQSPFGASQLMVAEREGVIVGVRAFMPWKLAAGGRVIDALRSADAATSPGLQRSGIFGRIRTEADRLLPPGAEIGFGTPNPKSYGATMKLGGREVVEVVRPWVRIAVHRLRRRPADPAVEAPAAAEALQDDSRLLGLLDAAGTGDGRLTTHRDPAYLRWRYGDAPLGYHAVGADGPGELRGLAIFRLRTARAGMTQAVIEELIVAPGDHHTAATLLRAVAGATRAPLMCCRFPSASPQRRAAVGMGFVPRRGGLPLVAKQLSPGAPPIDGPEHWALSMGDVEIL